MEVNLGTRVNHTEIQPEIQQDRDVLETKDCKLPASPHSIFNALPLEKRVDAVLAKPGDFTEEQIINLQAEITKKSPEKGFMDRFSRSVGLGLHGKLDKIKIKRLEIGMVLIKDKLEEISKGRYSNPRYSNPEYMRKVLSECSNLDKSCKRQGVLFKGDFDSITRASSLLISFNHLSSNLENLIANITLIPLEERGLVIEQAEFLLPELVPESHGFLMDCDVDREKNLRNLIKNIYNVPKEEREGVVKCTKLVLDGLGEYSLGEAQDGYMRYYSELIEGISLIPANTLETVVLDDVLSWIPKVAKKFKEINRYNTFDLSSEKWKELILGINAIPAAERATRITDILTNGQNADEILRRISGVAVAAVNRPDAHQVHRVAAIQMKPIYGFLMKELENTPILSLNDSLKLLNRSIQETDLSGVVTVATKNSKDVVTKQEIAAAVKKARTLMQNLLMNSKWEGALGVEFRNLGDTVNGELLLRTAMTYCSQHPESISLFLHQGLLDAINAYVDGPAAQNLDMTSCVAGIAERFMLCFRNLAAESTVLPDVQKLIYNHPDYAKFISMGDEENEEEKAEKAVWVTKYLDIKNIETLRGAIQSDLAAIKPVLLAEAQKVHKEDAKDIFETNAVKNMFKIFDDGKDLTAEARLKRIWDAIQQAKGVTS